MFYTVCPQQISELSVDLESKQKEVQSLEQDKSSLEQQLTGLVRNPERNDHKLTERREKDDHVAPLQHFWLQLPVKVGGFLNKCLLSK